MHRLCPVCPHCVLWCYYVVSQPPPPQKQVLWYYMIPFIAKIPPVSPIKQTEGNSHIKCIIRGFADLCCIGSTCLRANVWYTVSDWNVKNLFKTRLVLAFTSVCAHRSRLLCWKGVMWSHVVPLRFFFSCQSMWRHAQHRSLPGGHSVVDLHCGDATWDQLTKVSAVIFLLCWNIWTFVY